MLLLNQRANVRDSAAQANLRNALTAQQAYCSANGISQSFSMQATGEYLSQVYACYGALPPGAPLFCLLLRRLTPEHTTRAVSGYRCFIPPRGLGSGRGL